MTHGGFFNESHSREGAASITGMIPPPRILQGKDPIMLQMDWGETMVFNGCDITLTCGACPEQYDVHKGGLQIGYLRLRHGCFTANYRDCGGPEVYRASPKGDGIFEDDEREKYLTEAVDALLAFDEA